MRPNAKPITDHNSYSNNNNNCHKNKKINNKRHPSTRHDKDRERETETNHSAHRLLLRRTSSCDPATLRLE